MRLILIFVICTVVVSIFRNFSLSELDNMSGDLDLEIEDVLVEMKELSMEWRLILEEREEEKRSFSNLKTKHSLLKDKLYKVHSKHTKPEKKLLSTRGSEPLDAMCLRYASRFVRQTESQLCSNKHKMCLCNTGCFLKLLFHTFLHSGLGVFSNMRSICQLP